MTIASPTKYKGWLCVCKSDAMIFTVTGSEAVLVPPYKDVCFFSKEEQGYSHICVIMHKPNLPHEYKSLCMRWRTEAYSLASLFILAPKAHLFMLTQKRTFSIQAVLWTKRLNMAIKHPLRSCGPSRLAHTHHKNEICILYNIYYYLYILKLGVWVFKC